MGYKDLSVLLQIKKSYILILFLYYHLQIYYHERQYYYLLLGRNYHMDSQHSQICRHNWEHGLLFGSGSLFRKIRGMDLDIYY